MSNQSSWLELKDGVQLHADHIFQLADEGAATAARMAVALGTAGRLAIPGDPSPCRNAIRTDDEAQTIEVENLAVLTAGGYLAELPPPAKAFTLPAGGAEPFLNFYARSYGEGGNTEARWEKQAAHDPRAVTLVQWRADQSTFEVHPMPHSIIAQSEASELLRGISEGVDKLSTALFSTGQNGLARLALRPQQRHLLATLLNSGERVQALDAGVPVSVAISTIRVFATELLGWFQHSSMAVPSDDPGEAPDAVVRLMIRQATPDGLADYVKQLQLNPQSGTLLLRWLEVVRAATVGLGRLIIGEADEDPLEPVEQFEPDAWPDGLGLKYALKAGGRTVTLRCDMQAGIEPQLWWGVGPAGPLPHMEPDTLKQTEPGSFEALLTPAEMSENDLIAGIIDSPDTQFRAFMQRFTAAT